MVPESFPAIASIGLKFEAAVADDSTVAKGWSDPKMQGRMPNHLAEQRIELTNLRISGDARLHHRYFSARGLIVSLITSASISEKVNFADEANGGTIAIWAIPTQTCALDS